MEKGSALIRAEISIQRMLEDWKSKSEEELLNDHEAWIERKQGAYSRMLEHVSSVQTASYVGLSRLEQHDFKKEFYPIKWVRYLKKNYSWVDKNKHVDLRRIERSLLAYKIIGFVVKGVNRQDRRWNHETLVYFLRKGDYGWPYSHEAGHRTYPGEYVPWAVVRHHLEQAMTEGKYLPDRSKQSYGAPYVSRPDSLDHGAYALYKKGTAMSIEEIPSVIPDDILQLQDEGVIQRDNDSVQLDRSWLKTILDTRNPAVVVNGDIPTPSKKRKRAGTETLEDQISYIRATSASKKVIRKQHVELANKFKLWIESKGAENILFEQDFVDVRFTANGFDTIAELKTVGKTSPIRVIREAIGQLLHYNYYEDSELADRWLIVLDLLPSESDVDFVERLRVELEIPLHLLSLSEDGSFIFH